MMRKWDEQRFLRYCRNASQSLIESKSFYSRNTYSWNRKCVSCTFKRCSRTFLGLLQKFSCSTLFLLVQDRNPFQKNACYYLKKKQPVCLCPLKGLLKLFVGQFSFCGLWFPGVVFILIEGTLFLCADCELPSGAHFKAERPELQHISKPDPAEATESEELRNELGAVDGRLSC